MRLTITEVAKSIQRQFGGERVPDWKMRRIVDSLDSANAISIQRVGVYRTVAPEDVLAVANELRRIGRLPQETIPC